MKMSRQPWQWPGDVWRGHAGRIPAGRSTRGVSWPDGDRAAVAVSFDSDHKTMALSDAQTGPGRMSQAEYGARRGFDKIHRAHQVFDVSATFFVPAVSALLRGRVRRAMHP